jgi:hypothetical protein
MDKIDRNVLTDWNIFKDTVLSDLDLSGCKNTINGVCHNVKTVEQCIKLCDGYENCIDGYFIKTPDGDNLCAPLVERPDNPYYRMRDKKYYPITSIMDTWFFSKRPFPPDMPNALFYSDYFVLKTLNDEYISSDSTGEMSQNVVFSKDSPVNIQLLPAEITRNRKQIYIPVRNGDEVVINIPKTGFVMRKDETNDEIVWITRASVASTDVNTFVIKSKNEKKKIGDVLTYDEQFYFTYNDYPLVYDKVLKVHNESVENAIDDQTSQDIDMFFKMTPNVKCYYCDKDDGVCKYIPLIDTETKEEKAYYKGNPVTRNPDCWNMCKGAESQASLDFRLSFFKEACFSTPTNTGLLVMIIFFLFLIMIIYFFLYK